MKRVFLETYGCQMNVADSETMAGVLERAEESGPLAWMSEFAGAIDTLPPDAAERHTEYAHGRKRRLP